MDPGASRERIYGIFADPGVDVDEKIHRALDVGREFLDVSIGFVSAIDSETQTIEYALGDHPLIQSGERCPLEQAYCRRTVELESVLAVTDVAGAADVSELAYETFGLGTYIGAKVVVDDETYGTVCFADEAQRGRPFTEAERYLVELLARLVGQAFERAAYERELERRERELNERRERYRSVVDSSFDLVFRVDTDGEFTYLSRTVESLLGQDAEAYLGEHFTTMLPTSETIELAGAMFERVLAGETVEEYEFPLQHYYGHRVWVDIRVAPVYDGDVSDADRTPADIVGAQGMVRDATGRRRRIQLIRVLNRVLRHNLRNEMNVISGYAEIFRDRLTGEMAEYADRILEAGADLVELGETARDLDGILETRPRLRPMDVVPVVGTAVADVGEAYPAAAIQVDAPDDSVARCAPELEAAVRELTENAAKHAGDDPEIDVTVAEREERVEITIADDGPGLPEQERAVLEAGTETELIHGSGLGLWLVYAIVESLEAQLRVDGHESTSVTIVLPRARDPP